jgi:tRNA(Ile)-lysidine synthase
LSGGADSVTLLSVLLGLKQELGINVSAAHLNHCLRGEESDRDEQFVRELCNRLDVPLVYERADVKGFAERESLSIELAARKIRYEFLERVSDGVIATAHTANDNIETVLHNMVRGSGLKGICGIPPKRGRFIRPLLEVTREEIEQYCERNGLGYCIDSTNKNTVYTRNFIRHSVVPNLVEVNSNAIKNVSQMSKILRDDADYLNKTAANVLETVRNEEGLDVEGLKALHPAVASRCVALFYEQQVGKVPECTHVSSVLELLETNGKQSVQNDFFAVVKNGLLRFIPPVTHEKLPEVSVEKSGSISTAVLNLYPSLTPRF